MYKRQVHPESYAASKKLLALCGFKSGALREGGLTQLPARVSELGEEKVAQELEVGLPTLRDMIAELLKPGRDPRDELPPPMLRLSLIHI